MNTLPDPVTLDGAFGVLRDSLPDDSRNAVRYACELLDNPRARKADLREAADTLLHVVNAWPTLADDYRLESFVDDLLRESEVWSVEAILDRARRSGHSLNRTRAVLEQLHRRGWLRLEWHGIKFMAVAILCPEGRNCGGGR